jgi:hypothetical protein
MTMENFFMDVRFGLRMLRRNPGFTAAGLLTIAIGIGANAAVFSVVNSVLLKPLNYPKPEELVFLRLGRRERRGWQTLKMACCFRHRCTSRMQRITEHFSRWACGIRTLRM